MKIKHFHDPSRCGAGLSKVFSSAIICPLMQRWVPRLSFVPSFTLLQHTSWSSCHSGSGRGKTVRTNLSIRVTGVPALPFGDGSMTPLSDRSPGYSDTVEISSLFMLMGTAEQPTIPATQTPPYTSSSYQTESWRRLQLRFCSLSLVLQGDATKGSDKGH